MYLTWWVNIWTTFELIIKSFSWQFCEVSSCDIYLPDSLLELLRLLCGHRHPDHDRHGGAGHLRGHLPYHHHPLHLVILHDRLHSSRQCSSIMETLSGNISSSTSMMTSDSTWQTNVDMLAAAKSEEEWKSILTEVTSHLGCSVKQRSVQNAVRYCEKCLCIKPDRLKQEDDSCLKALISISLLDLIIVQSVKFVLWKWTITVLGSIIVLDLPITK